MNENKMEMMHNHTKMMHDHMKMTMEPGKGYTQYNLYNTYAL